MTEKLEEIEKRVLALEAVKGPTPDWTLRRKILIDAAKMVCFACKGSMTSVKPRPRRADNSAVFLHEPVSQGHGCVRCEASAIWEQIELEKIAAFGALYGQTPTAPKSDTVSEPKFIRWSRDAQGALTVVTRHSADANELHWKQKGAEWYLLRTGDLAHLPPTIAHDTQKLDRFTAYLPSWRVFSLKFGGEGRLLVDVVRNENGFKAKIAGLPGLWVKTHDNGTPAGLPAKSLWTFMDSVYAAAKPKTGCHRIAEFTATEFFSLMLPMKDGVGGEAAHTVYYQNGITRPSYMLEQTADGLIQEALAVLGYRSKPGEVFPDLKPSDESQTPL